MSLALANTLFGLTFLVTNSLMKHEQSLSAVENEKLAVTVGTECVDDVSSPQVITPVPVVESVTLETEPTAHHTYTSNSMLLQVPATDNFSAENSHHLSITRASPRRSLGNDGELHTEGTHCSQPAALSMPEPNLPPRVQAEEHDQLGSQSSFHPEGASCSTLQTEAPVQHLIVTAAMQADQSNQLVSQALVQQPLPLANLLPEIIHSGGTGSASVSQEPASCLPQILPMAALVPPQALHPDPLQNELTRLRKQVELRTRMHEEQVRA